MIKKIKKAFAKKPIEKNNKGAFENPEDEKFFRAVGILKNEYALGASMKKNECVDKDGSPLPWYTYPSIEYIKQLDFSGKRVFEFGSGNSSIFWAGIAKEVMSIESDKEWYQSRVAAKKDNLKILYKENKEDYYNSILKEKGDFDVVIVDGDSRDKCAETALKKVKENGLIILDNSDWCKKFEEFGRAVKILKKADLIQVDFCGFGPINDYTWATSFFFTRKFDFKSKDGDMQPVNITGGIHRSKDDSK